MKGALSRKLSEAWSLLASGKPKPMPRGWLTRDEIARLHAASPGSSDGVDEQTWRDLDLDAWLAQATGDCSVFGRQWLFARLRGCAISDRADVVQLPQLKALIDDERLARSWIDATAAMRCAEVEVAGTLFAPLPSVLPHWVSRLWAVPAGFGIAPGLIAAGLFFPGALLIVACVLVSGAVQIRLHPQSAAWQKQKRAIAQLLSCAMALRDPAAEDAACAPPMPDLKPLWAAFGPTWLERLAGLAEYADLLLLSRYRRLAADFTQIGLHRRALQDVFLNMSQREANAWLACHLRASESFCWNEARGGLAGATLTGMCNPLLARSRPIDVALGVRGIFLTGKNGSGKSTLLRSLAMNMVMARALGVCMAEAASVPRALVQTSIRIEDSLSLGRSLYVAELLRASDMLERAYGSMVSLVLFDEIFRGTNHMESVSAAAAVIQRLSAQAMVVVSSHHIDLAPWVERSMLPLLLAETATGLVLQPGVLAETNGIDLLLSHGFDADLHANALALHGLLAQRAAGKLMAGPASSP